MMHTFYKPRGFIALMSVIIISLILLSLTATANTAGFFSRFAGLDQEYKAGSYALAEACVNVGLLSLAQNYSYSTSNQQVVLGTDSCSIVSITTTTASPSGKIIIITTHAGYKSTFTTLAVTAQVQNPAAAPAPVMPAVVVTSWQELP